MHKRHSPSQANLAIARLPQHKRALTDVGADAITLEVGLSLNHLHTALLHLDDCTGALSSYNEWSQWLGDRHRRALLTTEDERLSYRDNYARSKEGENAQEAMEGRTTKSC
mmetsp:Transcript_18689/g.40105  ORF Transcript_18689/g.40105 Transcript_18689/m.40105 type:complete len:111 (+) Transcript_18689:84-416(+)